MSQEPRSELPPPPGENRVSPVDDRFEHYRIFRREDGSLWELGHGSMGVTYKAVDTNLDKPVALKIISTQFLGKETSKKRFRREARAAASLLHRHIAGVYHLGESGGNFFYAMEYVDGETVEALVQRTGPLPWRAALGVTLQITRALMAAHAKGLVHRDIKPANIMVVDEVDEQGVAKLIDFGLAKSAVEEEVAGSNVVTNASGFLGTPLYASPEQCEEQPADIRSDIYSLGVTLWYMLTGEPPFQGSLARVIHQQFYTPPPLEKLPADLPPGVSALLERMLAKDRAQRPQTPADLRTEIEACLRDPLAGQSPAVVPVPAPVPVSAARLVRPAPETPPTERITTARLSGETMSLPAKGDVGLLESRDVQAGETKPSRGRWVVLAALITLSAIAGGFGWFWNQRMHSPGSSIAPTSTHVPPSTVATMDLAPSIAPVATPRPSNPPVRPTRTVPIASPIVVTRLPTTAPAQTFQVPDVSAHKREDQQKLDILLKQAREAFMKAHWREAIDLYSQIIELSPNSLEAWDQCGSAHDYLGETSQAEDNYIKATVLEPKNLLDHFFRGDAFESIGKYVVAWQDYRQAIKIPAEDAFLSWMRGHAYSGIGKYEEAIKNYTGAIQFGPQDAVVFIERGYSYNCTCKYKEAIKDYTEAIRLDPHGTYAVNSRGYAYTCIGKYEEAIKDYSEAIHLDSQNAAFLKNRAEIYRKTGSQGKAANDEAMAKLLENSK